jgi:hypothetical protein
MSCRLIAFAIVVVLSSVVVQSTMFPPAPIFPLSGADCAQCTESGRFFCNGVCYTDGLVCGQHCQICTQNASHCGGRQPQVACADCVTGQSTAAFCLADGGMCYIDTKSCTAGCRGRCIRGESSCRAALPHFNGNCARCTAARAYYCSIDATCWSAADCGGSKGSACGAAWCAATTAQCAQGAGCISCTSTAGAFCPSSGDCYSRNGNNNPSNECANACRARCAESYGRCPHFGPNSTL